MPKRRRRGFDPYLDPGWQPSGEPGWWRAKNFPMGKWGMIIEDWPSEIAIERYNEQLNRYNRELEKWYKGGQKGDAPKKPVLPARPPKSYDPGMPSRVAQKLFGKEAVQQRFKEWLAGRPGLGAQPGEGMITRKQYEAWQESPFYREWADTQFYPGGSPGEMRIVDSMDYYKWNKLKGQLRSIMLAAARDPGYRQRAIERGELPEGWQPGQEPDWNKWTQDRIEGWWDTPPIPETEGEIMPNFGMPRRRRQPLAGMMPSGGAGYSPVLTPEHQTGFNPALRPARRRRHPEFDPTPPPFVPGLKPPGGRRERGGGYGFGGAEFGPRQGAVRSFADTIESRGGVPGGGHGGVGGRWMPGGGSSGARPFGGMSRMQRATGIFEGLPDGGGGMPYPEPAPQPSPSPEPGPPQPYQRYYPHRRSLSEPMHSLAGMPQGMDYDAWSDWMWGRGFNPAEYVYTSRGYPRSRSMAMYGHNPRRPPSPRYY